MYIRVLNQIITFFCTYFYSGCNPVRFVPNSTLLLNSVYLVYFANDGVQILKSQVPNLGPNFQQVAQRATIAHLRASKTSTYFELFSSKRVSKDFLNWSRAAIYAVHGSIRLNFQFIQGYIVVLVTCGIEEDPIKNEGARGLARL